MTGSLNKPCRAMTLRSAVLAVSAALAALDVPSAVAQPALDEDLSDLESLLGEEVVNTASRSAERSSTAPATVTIISGATLRRYGMRSLDEALGFLGLGAFVADAGRDYVSGVDTGFQGVLLRDRNKHILVLVDGHVTNAQSSGETRLDVSLGMPLELIDHVEVMLGPGSVSYGSNAMMAVINVVTLRAADYGAARLVAEGTLAAPVGIDGALSWGGGDANYGGRYRLGGGFASRGTLWGKPAEIVLHAEWQQEISATLELAYQNGPFEVRPGEPGWGGVGNHRMHTPMAYVNARFGDFRFVLQGNSYYRTLPLVGTFAEPNSTETLNAARAELRHDANLTPKMTLVSRLYADHVRTEEISAWTLEYYCLPGQQLDGCHFSRRNASTWVGFEQQLNVDWKLDGRFLTTIGGDLRWRYGRARPADYTDLITGDGPFTVKLPYWDSSSVIGAMFAQQVVQVHDRAAINVGARFDADSLYGAHLSPRAALILQPADRSTLRLGYSAAFRAPSAYELYDTDPTYVIRPDNLDAEIVGTADLEFAHRLASGSFSLRGFVSTYEGLIEYRTATEEEFDAAFAQGALAPNVDQEGVQLFDNSAVIRAFGATVATRTEPADGVELAVNLTVAANDLRGVGPLPIIPTYYGNARASYRLGTDGTTLGVVGRFSGRRSASTYDEDGNYIPKGPSAGMLGEFRFIAHGPLRAVPGLQWRAFVNASLSGRQPFLESDGPLEDYPDNTLAFDTNPRLFALVGINYDLP